MTECRWVWCTESSANRLLLLDCVEIDSQGQGMALFALAVNAGLENSNAAARRLISQGGLLLDGEKHTDTNQVIMPGEFVLRAGKKRFVCVTLS